MRHNRVFAEPGIHDCVIVLDNLKPSFNIGKIFRSAEAFGIREIHLIRTGFFDVKAAKGTFKRVPAHFHDAFEPCWTELNAQGYRFYLFDQTAAEPLHAVSLPRKSAFIFGHEEFGISFDREKYADIIDLAVEQVGRVDSLNVSIAASVGMYEYYRQHRLPSGESRRE